MRRDFKATAICRKYLWLGAVGFLFLAFIAYSYFLPPQTTWKNNGNDVDKPVAEYVFFSKLTGLGVEKPEEENPEIVGVMIDNHPQAHPQSGLKDASIVYEAPAEGGITRFLAIFAKNQNLDKVGPVRSARPYYLNWMEEYGRALYMHCGGSPEALKMIENENIFHANEMVRGSYFWRDNLRASPHNLYTSSANWNKYFEKYPPAGKTTELLGWKFSSTTVSITGGSFPLLIEEGLGGGAIGAKSIKIKYWADYAVEWKYNADKQNYARYVNGVLSEENGQPITAANVVVQSVYMEILDELGRREIETVGKGDVRVLRDGQLVLGNWKRKDRAERTRFYSNKEDKEIPLRPGQTWIEVIPRNTGIEITN